MSLKQRISTKRPKPTANPKNLIRSRKKRSNEESQMQQAFFRWVKLEKVMFNGEVYQLIDYIWANPNGGLRTKLQGAIIKREGGKAGVLDISLMFPWKGCPGMFIELKTANGTLSENQEIFIANMQRVGYKTCVVRTIDECKKSIQDYFS